MRRGFVGGREVFGVGLSGLGLVRVAVEVGGRRLMRLGGGVGWCVFAVPALNTSVELGTGNFRFDGCELG